MFNRRHLSWLPVATLFLISLVLVACGDLVDVIGERAGAQPQDAAQPEEEVVAQATPTRAPSPPDARCARDCGPRR